MSCDNVITVQDLETDKKHSTFYREVITGKAGGTGADIDSATNAVTGQTQSTLPKVLSNVGFSPAGFDFTTGGTLTERDKAIFYQPDGNWYSWGGTLPKVVPPASSPASTGGIADNAWNVSTSAFMYRDFEGFTSELLAQAGIVDDGQPDEIGNSQRVEAMRKMFGNIGTVSDIAAGKFKVGTRVHVADRALGVFLVQPGGTADGFGILDAGNGNTAIYQPSQHVQPEHLGAVALDQNNPSATFSDGAFAAAQNFAEASSKKVFHGGGLFRLLADYELKAPTVGNGIENTLIMFESGFGFRNYAGSIQNKGVTELNGIHWLSNKESKWNSVDAGGAYVSGITSFFVRNKYGQRVAKGNKTTTPNNILSNTPPEQQAGTGFWNKDYAQWMQTNGVQVDITGVPLVYTGDSCRWVNLGGRKVITQCKFSGFTHGLVTGGCYEQAITDNVFESCRVGIYATSNAFFGGDTGAKSTTTSIKRNLFADNDIGVYADGLLQSSVDDRNVFQPCTCAVYVAGGGMADSTVADNYHEIGHTLFRHVPNLISRTIVSDNFTNSSYNRYLGWVSNGQHVKFRNPKGSQKVKLLAPVQTSEIDEGFTADVDLGFFRQNNNVIQKGKTKEIIYRTVGNGTTFTITKIWGSAPVDAGFVSPVATPSTSGITFTDSSRIVNIERMNSGTYYYFNPNDANPQDKKVYYFKDSLGADVDLRANGVTNTIKVLWVE